MISTQSMVTEASLTGDQRWTGPTTPCRGCSVVAVPWTGDDVISLEVKITLKCVATCHVVCR